MPCLVSTTLFEVLQINRDKMYTPQKLDGIPIFQMDCTLQRLLSLFLTYMLATKTESYMK